VSITNSPGLSPEILQDRLAKRAAGQPVEHDPKRKARLAALTDEAFARFANKHGIADVADRDAVTAKLLDAGFGDEWQLAGIV
jgi:hypothetical protein